MFGHNNPQEISTLSESTWKFLLRVNSGLIVSHVGLQKISNAQIYTGTKNKENRHQSIIKGNKTGRGRGVQCLKWEHKNKKKQKQNWSRMKTKSIKRRRNIVVIHKAFIISLHHGHQNSDRYQCDHKPQLLMLSQKKKKKNGLHCAVSLQVCTLGVMLLHCSCILQEGWLTDAVSVNWSRLTCRLVWPLGD